LVVIGAGPLIASDSAENDRPTIVVCFSQENPMAADERWMDDLAQKQATRLADEADGQEAAERDARETQAAIDHDLPSLKSQLGQAAERETERFKQKMGFGAELVCLIDPAGKIEVIWSKNQGAQLTIQVVMSSRSLNVEVTHRNAPTHVNLPSASIRARDGHLEVYVNGELASPEDAISRLLRPFFEFVVNEA
jgi:hypothetical protein